MDDRLQKELIESEQLKEFSVVELYCEICGDMTPHHLDDSKAFLKEEDDMLEEPDYVSPISEQECVICRENEEQELDLNL